MPDLTGREDLRRSLRPEELLDDAVVVGAGRTRDDGSARPPCPPYGGWVRPRRRAAHLVASAATVFRHGRSDTSASRQLAGLALGSRYRCTHYMHGNLCRTLYSSAHDYPFRNKQHRNGD